MAAQSEIRTINGIEVSLAQHAQLCAAFRKTGMTPLRANGLARSILTGTINQNGVNQLCLMVGPSNPAQ
ncbi:MAG: hypothetical protein AAGD25_06470 [Cyanobacteria bacterium P01_F01_bin.150]